MGPNEIRRDKPAVVFVGDDVTASKPWDVVRISIEPKLTPIDEKQLKNICEVIQRRPLNRAERRAKNRKGKP